MAVSIADVAARANVSISTVSRVLNRRELVNEDTRRRVEAVIRKLGYRPNAFARGLMLRRSEMVGLVLPDIHGEFYSEIIRGADAEARRLGYNLVVSSFTDEDESHSLLDTLQKRSFIDGVAVMIAEVSDHVERMLADFHSPVVLLDGSVESAALDNIVIDQQHGATALTRHLVRQCGVRRIIFLGGLKTNVDTRERLEAQQRVLREYGIEQNVNDVFHLDYRFETAHRLAAERLAEWRGAGNCVFAANDEMAAGVVAAALEAGVPVPGELAVVGFDDTRIAMLTRPALTTVRVPMSALGAKAIELLCARIKEPERATQCVSLHPTLVIRASCGAARGSAAED